MQDSCRGRGAALLSGPAPPSPLSDPLPQNKPWSQHPSPGFTGWHQNMTPYSPLGEFLTYSVLLALSSSGFLCPDKIKSYLTLKLRNEMEITSKFRRCGPGSTTYKQYNPRKTLSPSSLGFLT